MTKGSSTEAALSVLCFIVPVKPLALRPGIEFAAASGDVFGRAAADHAEGIARDTCDAATMTFRPARTRYRRMLESPRCGHWARPLGLQAQGLAAILSLRFPMVPTR